MEMDQGKRIREMALILLKNNTNVFIKDLDYNIYFAKILIVNEDSVEIECYAPIQRKGTKIKLYFPQIIKLNEVRE